MDTKIKASDIFFSKFHIKASEMFYIPSLQRPYVWESKKQVEKLWEDVIENDSPYYIGSIVSILNAGTTGRDQIIDGQQRLTTLHLMLVALKIYIQAIVKDEKLKKSLTGELDDYLYKFRGDGKHVRLSFADEKSNEIFSLILENKKIDQNSLNETQKRFFKNFSHLKDNIHEYCGTGKIGIQRVQELLDKIKSLQLIFIECQDKSAAFRLFESINATGIDLATTDMIKNAIFEYMFNDEKMMEYVETGWKDLSAEFNDQSSMIKTYIRHHWITTQDYTSHSRLFEDFLREHKDKSSVIKYTRSLFELAPVYSALRNGNIEVLSKIKATRNDIEEIKQTLVFLKSLDVDQIYSVLLSLYVKSPEKFKKDLVSLVAFQFVYKYIPGSPSLLEKKFANFCKGKTDKNSLKNDLFKICKGKSSDFVQKIIEKMKYTGSNNIDIQFILEKYIYKLGKPTLVFSDPTIEHIIPQDNKDKIFSKFKVDDKITKKLVHSIGNLTILEKFKNSDKNYFNQSFDKKFPLYKDEEFIGNKNICKFKFETLPEDAINSRSAMIAKEIYEIFLQAINTGVWIKHK